MRRKTSFMGVYSRLAVLAAGLSVLAGCAAPCQRVAGSRDAFLARTTTAHSPHLSLSVPFAMVDQMIAAQVGSLPPLRLQMPAIGGVSAGTLALRVVRVRTRPGPPGQLGFVITVGLDSGRTRVLDLDIEAEVSPRIDPKRGEIVVGLEGRNIQSIEPKLDRGGARKLADFVWKQLPSAARMLTSKQQIEQLARGASDELMREAFTLVKRELLDDLGEITSIELQLPDMPVAGVELSTAPGYLTLDVTTSLPVAGGLAGRGGPGGRVAGVHPNVVQVRIAGPTAAELANYAMTTGEVPERWSLAGEPDEDGPLFAGVAWNDAEGKTLVLHLWSLEKDCAHVVLGATPQITLAAEHLQLRTDDAKIERVEGPLQVRAGIWFSGLGRQSFEFVEETAASFDFEIGGQPLAARVQSASLTGDELVLGLKLDRGAPRKQARAK